MQLEGRDIYIREGCVGCHSQMIRPFRAETERYGHYSVAGESVWDHPFLWGSKRTGPDLARVGGRYSDEWHRAHLYNPRNVVPWGSKRTGPDLARVGGRYSDEWHRAHLYNPRNVVPESIMPAYPWLVEQSLDGKDTAKKMSALRTLGVPYSEEDVAGASDAVKGKSEMDALVAYLQVLGTAVKNKR
nr:cbb3-type cytochrome c oxidase subunit II [Pseudomonas chengduensis]